MGKLTKREIQETLDKMPTEAILTGKANKRELTTKQIEFAKGLALGLPKAQAYRKAYNSKGSSKTVAVKGSQMAKRDDIQIIADGFREAFEAREYQKPAQIRELIVHNLLKLSLSEDVKEAQRLKALDMLGKLSDVGAFTERKETTVIHESSKIKAQLLDQLKTIVSGDNLVRDIDADAESLLAELTGSPVANSQDDESETPPPRNRESTIEPTTHSIPHTQSAPESVSQSEISEKDEEDQ